MSEDSSNLYTEDYFLRGPETGLSNYVAYSWKPEQTLQHAIYVERHLRMSKGESILDVGCARGYFVKAMRMLGYDAYGIDISRWAIENCHEDAKGFVLLATAADFTTQPWEFDWINFKDVAEHIPMDKLIETVQALSKRARKGILVIVPLSAYSGGKYVREEDEKDSTHIHRWTLSDWILFLTKNTKDFTVSGSYSIRGIKECCKAESMGCGFLTLTRI